MAAKSFMTEGPASDKYNTGGLSGGLMALGEYLGTVAAGAATQKAGEQKGSGLGRGLAAAGMGLAGSMSKFRDQKRKRDFTEYARQQWLDAPEGTRVKEMWQAVASGDPALINLVQNLWTAENYDDRSAALRAKAAAAGAPKALTYEQLSNNQEIQNARQTLGRIADTTKKGDMSSLIATESWQQRLIKASQVMVGQSEDPNVNDPENAYWERLSSSNLMLTGVGEQPDYPVRGRDGVFRFIGIDGAPLSRRGSSGDGDSPDAESPAEDTNEGPGLLDQGLAAGRAGLEAIGVLDPPAQDPADKFQDDLRTALSNGGEAPAPPPKSEHPNIWNGDPESAAVTPSSPKVFTEDPLMLGPDTRYVSDTLWGGTKPSQNPPGYRGLQGRTPVQPPVAPTQGYRAPESLYTRGPRAGQPAPKMLVEQIGEALFGDPYIQRQPGNRGRGNVRGLYGE